MQKKRYLLKLSGEVLKGTSPSIINYDILNGLCERLSKVLNNGNIDLGVVIGGGNIYRGGRGIPGFNRLYGDQIGMMATVINGLAIVERLRAFGIYSNIQSAVKVEGVVDLFNKDKVEETFSKNGVVLFVGGTGNPYFSTDTTAVLRGLQINADYVFKATKVDGIFDKDPHKYNDAKKYDYVTYKEIIEKNIQIMDMTSIIMMAENKMKLMVFNMMQDNHLEKALNGEDVGTIVKE
ncbi:MAG TPA: UMP kinase [Spirochaetota bacterium]|nr:UMP kinase [Spirochaetota bacterium]